jgi:Flp pilus assembly CpaF family ATPase
LGFRVVPPVISGVVPSKKTLQELVEVTLRSSPERMMVCGVRGEEAAELVRAANAGSAVLCALHTTPAAHALDALAKSAHDPV